MGLYELEMTGRAVTRALDDRNDVAVGAGLALHSHNLIDQELSESRVDVYGSKDAYGSELQSMAAQGLIRYHVADLEYVPSVKGGIQILAFEDAVRLQAQKAATPRAPGRVPARDFAYLADIHRNLGRGGIDTVLATSQLASDVPGSLSLEVNSAAHGRNYGLGTIAKGHLQDLGKDLDLFEAASAAAEARNKAEAAIQQSLTRSTDAVSARTSGKGLLGRFRARQAKTAGWEASEVASRLSQAATDSDRRFVSLITQRLSGDQRFGGRQPGVRRERQTPSTSSGSYGQAYAGVVSRALQVTPAYSTAQTPRPPAYPYAGRPSTAYGSISPTPPAYPASLGTRLVLSSADAARLTPPGTQAQNMASPSTTSTQQRTPASVTAFSSRPAPQNRRQGSPSRG